MKIRTERNSNSYTRNIEHYPLHAFYDIKIIFFHLPQIQTDRPASPEDWFQPTSSLTCKDQLKDTLD